MEEFPEHAARGQVVEQLPGAYYNLARDHQNKGNATAAVSAYNTVLRYRPRSPKTLYNLGILLRDMGAYGKADALLQTARSLEPKNPDIFAVLGTVAVYRDSLDSALNYYIHSLELQPGHVEAMKGLVELRLRQGRFTDAEKVARRLLQKNASDPERHALLAYLYEHNQECERYGNGFQAGKAAQAYRNALAFAAGDIDYMYNLGVVLGRDEKWKEAEATFLGVLSADSTHSEVLKWLPVIRARLDISPDEPSP